MSLSPEGIAEHYNDTVAQQIEFFHANVDEMADIADGDMPVFLKRVNRLLEEPVSESVSEKMPTPLHVLLEAAYFDLGYQFSGGPNKPKAVADITGKLIRQLVSPEVPEAPIVGETINNDVDACSYAETCFAQTVSQANNRLGQGQPAISVYHSSDGTPILLRKKRQTSTALNLTWLNINGVDVPPFTVVKPTPKMSRERTGRAYVGLKDGGEFEAQTFELPTQVEINLGRLSPWAHPAKIDRALFGVDLDYYDGVGLLRERLKTVTEFGPRKILRAAEAIMKACGVLGDTGEALKAA